MAVKLSELLQLPVEERLKLVEALWDSIAECPEALELTAEEKKELDRRLAAYESDPDASSSASWTPSTRASRSSRSSTRSAP